MQISFFIDVVLGRNVIITYNFRPENDYDFKDFFWSSKEQNNGNMFVAINGLVTNGNLYLDEAIANGYKIILSDNLLISEEKANLYQNIVFIVVKNTHDTLTEMAIWGRERFQGVKIVTTGSSGKTTTNYLIANVLKNFGTVIYTDKYNTQYYLKKLCFYLHCSTSNFFVAELSSDGLGFIDLYGKIIKPDYSIITSIGGSHLFHFKTRNNIFLEKISIFKHTKKKCFINSEYRKKIEEEGSLDSQVQKKIEYINQDFTIQEVKNKKTKIKNITFMKNTVLSNPNFKGSHNYQNINLILHLLKTMDLLPNPLINQTLSNICAFPGRGNIIRIKNKKIDLSLVCEHHNSNYESFCSAIDTIEENTLVIMGYFYELGEETEEKTLSALREIEKNPYIINVYIGDPTLYTIPGINNFPKVLSREIGLLDYIKNMDNKNIKKIFLKGSRGSQLEKYIKLIINNEKSI